MQAKTEKLQPLNGEEFLNESSEKDFEIPGDGSVNSIAPAVDYYIFCKSCIFQYDKYDSTVSFYFYYAVRLYWSYLCFFLRNDGSVSRIRVWIGWYGDGHRNERFGTSCTGGDSGRSSGRRALRSVKRIDYQPL